MYIKIIVHICISKMSSDVAQVQRLKFWLTIRGDGDQDPVASEEV